MEKFTYESRYGNYNNCYFVLGKYADTNSLAFEIHDHDEGPVTRCTVNIGFQTYHGHAHLKTYSENEGLLEFLTKLGVVKRVLRWRPCGVTSVPLVELDMDVLYKYTMKEEK